MIYPIQDCPFHAGIGCDIHHRECKKCGWNPKVEKKRIKKIREKRHGKSFVL